MEMALLQSDLRESGDDESDVLLPAPEEETVPHCTTDTNTQHASYRADIDALRAVAVVAVILYHIDHSWSKGGYLGVDMFFVISGFVVTKTLHGRSYCTWHNVLLEFYSRRMKRLTPALVFVIMISTVFVLLFVNRYPVDETEHVARTGLFACFAATNIDMYLNSQSYFNAGTDLNFFMHMWSLGVEEQFYLTLPVLLLLTGSLKAIKLERHILPVAVLLVVCGISFWLFIITPFNLRFFGLQFRYWELGTGCILYYISTHWRRTVFVPVRSLLLVISVGLLYWLLGYKPAHNDNSALNIAACLLTSILILIHPKHKESVIFDAYLRCTNHPIVQWIGKRSYTLYLCHWPLLVLLRYTLLISWTTITLLFLPALLPSVALIYKHIEMRLRYAEWNKRAYVTILIGLGMCAVSAGFVGLAFIPGLKRALYVGKSRNDGEGDLLYDTHCMTHFKNPSGFSDATLFTTCGFKQSKNVRRLITMGDSHGTKLHGTFLSINNILHETHNKTSEFNQTNMAYFYRYSCGFPTLQEWCSAGYQRLLRVFNASVGPGDVVILSNRIENEINVMESCVDINGIHDHTLCSDKVRKQLFLYIEQLNIIADIIQRNNASLLIMSVTPIYPTQTTPLCSTEWFRPFTDDANCILNKPYELERRLLITSALETFVAQKKRVAFQNMFDIMCLDRACNAFNATINAYSVSDEGHPVDAYVDHYAKQIANRIIMDS